MNDILQPLRRIPPAILAYATVLVAFLLRVYRLADQNIWWDEGWSLWLSQKDLAWIALRTAADEHPPLHYWMLHFWNLLAGTQAFAGRFLSVAFGVLTVALLYRIGKRLVGARAGSGDAGTWVGLLAALFLAVARFHIWWSQDIKNYTPSMFFAFAAVWFALDLLKPQAKGRPIPLAPFPKREGGTADLRPSPSRSGAGEDVGHAAAQPSRFELSPKAYILGYAVCAALALWTHYLAALVLIALNAYALYVLASGRRAGGQPVALSGAPVIAGGAPVIASGGTVILSGAKNLSHDDGDPQAAREILRSAQNDSRAAAQNDNCPAHNDSRAAARNDSASAQRDNLPHDGSGLVGGWVAANLLGAALFVPWLYLYLENAATWQAAPTFDFGLFLKLVATVLPLGVTTYIETYAPLTLALTALAALGCLPIKRPTDRPSSVSAFWLLPALVVLVPPFLIYVISLTPVAFFAPKVQARYLLVLLPAYVLLLALGVSRLYRFSRYLGLAAAVFVLAASGWVLSDYYGQRRAQDHYATLANTINALAQRDDLVLLDTDQEWPTFLYYLRRPLEWLGAPNGAPMTLADAETLAQRAFARHTAVWLVAIPDALATDPQRLLEARLARDLSKQWEQSYGDKRLVLYAASPRDVTSVPAENFAPQYAADEMAGTFVRFLGFDLPVHEARAGDTLRLVTYWSATKPAEMPISLRNVTTKMARVPAGPRVRVETDLVVPPNAVGDLPLDLLDRELARVRVEPRALAAGTGQISHPVDVRLGEAIYLVGYDRPIGSFRPGEVVPVTLYWRTDAALETGYTAFVHLLGTTLNPAQGNLLWGQIDRVPCAGDCPTTAWPPGQVLPDVYRVTLDAHAPPGRYEIEVGLYDAATGERLPLEGGGDSIVLEEITVQ